MRYINSGARGPDGAYVPTKTALRALLRTSPESVVFERTSLYDTEEGTITGATIPNGVIMTVVGPDPYRKRRWYANVLIGRSGRPVVR